MKLARYKKAEDVPINNWRDHAVILWREDECAPDAEPVQDAFKRMTGRPIERHDPVNQMDEGDCIAVFYKSGWMAGYTPMGDFIGVMVYSDEPKEEKDHPRMWSVPKRNKPR